MPRASWEPHYYKTKQSLYNNTNDFDHLWEVFSRNKSNKDNNGSLWM